MDLYGISIALTIRSFDHSLFIRLILRYQDFYRPHCSFGRSQLIGRLIPPYKCTVTIDSVL